MDPGGGHEKNNPRLGKKSPLRGDKQREKKAGRKRIDREYRKKGKKEISLTDEPLEEALTPEEYKVIFTLNKKKAYGDHSTDLIKLVRMRNIKPSSIPDFIENLVRKLDLRGWGSVYPGDDGITYISLNLEKKSTIETYLEINEP